MDLFPSTVCTWGLSDLRGPVCCRAFRGPPASTQAWLATHPFAATTNVSSHCPVALGTGLPSEDAVSRTARCQWVRQTPLGQLPAGRLRRSPRLRWWERSGEGRRAEPGLRRKQWLGHGTPVPG